MLLQLRGRCCGIEVLQHVQASIIDALAIRAHLNTISTKTPRGILKAHGGGLRGAPVGDELVSQCRNLVARVRRVVREL